MDAFNELTKFLESQLAQRDNEKASNQEITRHLKEEVKKLQEEFSKAESIANDLIQQSKEEEERISKKLKEELEEQFQEKEQANQHQILSLQRENKTLKFTLNQKQKEIDSLTQKLQRVSMMPRNPPAYENVTSLQHSIGNGLSDVSSDIFCYKYAQTMQSKVAHLEDIIAKLEEREKEQVSKTQALEQQCNELKETKAMFEKEQHKDKEDAFKGPVEMEPENQASVEMESEPDESNQADDEMKQGSQADDEMEPESQTSVEMESKQDGPPVNVQPEDQAFVELDFESRETNQDDPLMSAQEEDQAVIEMESEPEVLNQDDPQVNAQQESLNSQASEHSFVDLTMEATTDADNSQAEQLDDTDAAPNEDSSQDDDPLIPFTGGKFAPPSVPEIHLSTDTSDSSA